jgi:hypothetical protein
MIVLLMTLVVATVSFAVVMAFQLISHTFGDLETSLVLRWAAGVLLVIGAIDAFLLLIGLAMRSISATGENTPGRSSNESDGEQVRG